MAKDVIITPANGFIEFVDTTRQGSIYEENGDLYLTSNSGNIVLGVGPANIEVGNTLTSVDFTFLGGGTISSGGNLLNIGISGDTVNLNTTGVTYNFPNTIVTTSDYTASDVLTKIKTVDGSGSDLDADLLDGQQGSYYQNAGNLNAGTLLSARLSGTYSISITGNAANATFATTANNALRFNGKQESQLSVASAVSATTATTATTAANATFATTANNALRFNGKQESQLSVANAVYATTAGSVLGGVATANNATYAYGKQESQLSVANAVYATTAGSVLGGVATANNATYAYGKQESQLSVASAAKLTTTRNIALSGDVTGSANFDGTSNISITATVVDDSHNHVISNVDGLQTALDGKLNLSGGTMTGPITISSTGNIIYEDSGGVYIPRPQNATYKTSTATLTGAISIQLPTALYTASDMLSFWVDVYDYSSNETISIFVYGYAYGSSTGQWTNNGATILTTRTDKDFTVRFCHDGTRHVVCIGETSSTWAYPQIVVRDFQAGFTAAAATTDDGWAITFLTTLPTVMQTSTGNVVVAKQLQTPRSINGTDFDGTANITTANWGTARTLTIGSTGKSVNGSGNVSWSLAEIGAPSTTGTGASGSWGISITGSSASTTGNAATATALATTRNIALSGDVTGSANFDGTSNISITATVVDDSHNHTVIEPKANQVAESASSRTVIDSGIYTFNTLNASLGNGTPTGYWSTIAWGNGAAGSAELAADWTSSGNNLWYRSLRDTTDNWWPWKRIFTDEYHPNADTLTTARTINGVSFNGSANITVTASTTNTLTRGTYLTGANFNGSAATTWAVDATTTATASKVVARDSNGDDFRRYGFADYFNMSHAASGSTTDSIFYSSGDNYIRKNNATGFRASLNVPTRTGGDASGTWGINITGSAAAPTFDSLTNKTSGTGTYTTSGDFRAPIFYDSNNTAFYIDAASTSILNAATIKDITTGNNTDGWGRLVNAGSALYIQAGSLNSGSAVAQPILFGNMYGGTTRMSIDASGNVIAVGNITAYGTPSDIRLKENIENIPNALQKVLSLNGVNFNYKKDGSRSTGVIAQEVEKVLPEVIYETHDIDNTDETFKAVRYGNMVGLLIEAIKDQQKIIDAQNDKINTLEVNLNSIIALLKEQ